ncbi:hypothetical protein EYF80_063353 [Liparis tanakae]|uniref:Uncharacterized protein n=1 Tax=Liparis tanakae TaxID=230148 RepID=A0A4Z2ED68_9TELE|nr:hypothetical protein EYF80_063353 [Liparis tanakae]
MQMCGQQMPSVESGSGLVEEGAGVSEPEAGVAGKQTWEPERLGPANVRTPEASRAERRSAAVTHVRESPGGTPCWQEGVLQQASGRHSETENNCKEEKEKTQNNYKETQ